MPPTTTHHAARYPRAQFTAAAASSSSSAGPSSTQARGGDRGTDEPETRRGRRPFTHRGIFAREVRALLYAFGDVPDADPASVDLLEDLAVDFLTDLCHRARPSPYALPQGPGMRALVPASELSSSTVVGGGEKKGPASGAGAGGGVGTLLGGGGGGGAELHPAAISAIAAGSSVGVIQAHPALAPPPLSAAAAASSSSSSKTQQSSSSSAAGQQQQTVLQQPILPLYVPLPPTSAGHPYFTRNRIKVDDLKHALRKDGKKYARVEELLYLDKVIKDAKRQVNVHEP